MHASCVFLWKVETGLALGHHVCVCVLCSFLFLNICLFFRAQTNTSVRSRFCPSAFVHAFFIRFRAAVRSPLWSCLWGCPTLAGVKAARRSASPSWHRRARARRSRARALLRHEKNKPTHRASKGRIDRLKKAWYNAYKGSGQKGHYWSGAWSKKGKGEDKKDANKDKSKGKKDGDIEFPAYSSLVQPSSSASTTAVDSKQIKEAVAAYLVEHGLQTSEEAVKVLETGPLAEIQAEQKSLNTRKKATQKIEKLKAKLTAKKKAWVQFQERLDAHRKSQKEIYELEVKELEKEIEAATQDLETMLREAGRPDSVEPIMSPEVLGAENLELKTELLASRRALTELTDRFNAYLVQHGDIPATPVGPALDRCFFTSTGKTSGQSCRNERSGTISSHGTGGEDEGAAGGRSWQRTEPPQRSFAFSGIERLGRAFENGILGRLSGDVYVEVCLAVFQ